MTKLDITQQTRNLDAYLATLDDPRHRRIIANYRRHAIFEITGNKEKIFTPDMTVEHPVYFLNLGGTSLTLDGREQVLGFYSSLEQLQATVMVFEDERMAVGDWGFSSEGWIHTFTPGHLVPEQFGADPERLYLVHQFLAMHWPFDERARMIGEHVYEHAALAYVTEIPAEEYVTLEEARERLLPLQQELPAFEPVPVG